MSEPAITLSLIVAMAENGTIGREGAMPWHLSTDLKRFRAFTLKKPVIMGRKTYLSIGRPLPGRANIVISRNADFIISGARVCPSFEAALECARVCAARDGIDEIFVIGGAEIFKLALPLADKIYLTEILAAIEGDTFLPPFDFTSWQPLFTEKTPAGEKDTHPTRFTLYQRADNLSSRKA